MGRKVQDLTGFKFGMLTVIDVKREKNKIYLLCNCDCGNLKWIRSDTLKNGKVTSCGCNQYVDLLNKKIGKLTVVAKTDKRTSRGGVLWECKCDCGNLIEISSSNLNKTRSCGCTRKEKCKDIAKKMAKSNYDKNIIDDVNISAIKKKTLFKHNTSGVTGVFYDTHNKKWVAQIYFKNKCYRLGRFENKEEAILARQEGEEKLHNAFLSEKGFL